VIKKQKNEWDFDKKLNIVYLGYFIIVFLFKVTSFICVLSVEAADLGVYGKSYPIKETDIEQEIARKLSIYQENGELEKFQKNYQKEVTKQIKSPNRVSGITDAVENRTRTFNPTIYLEEDIAIPKGGIEEAKKNPELIEYEVLHKAGTAINPLNYMLFNEPLIFVDGNNEEQLEYAREYQDKNQLAKIILIDGSPGFKEINGKEYQYFFDQWGAYSQRFKIVRVPSVVYQKEGDTVLTINEINLNNERKEIIGSRGEQNGK
jgi:conjugal transfer pilus assembly protein TraW